MVKRIVAAMAFGLLAVSGIAGCYSTGKATGEAVEETREGTREFKRGYEAGKQ